MPGHDQRPVYKFGVWEIDLARREMRLNGIATDVGSRAFEIVETLVQSAGELIDKYDLMNRVWPGAAVEENTLQAQISAIRKALGPDRGLLKTSRVVAIDCWETGSLSRRILPRPACRLLNPLEAMSQILRLKPAN